MGNAVSAVGVAVVDAALWATAPSSASSGSRGAGDFSPTYDDVLKVLDIFGQQARLPAELALQIVELAEYWPSVTRSWTGDTVVSAGMHGRRTVQTRLVTPPLPDIPGAPAVLVRRVSVWTDSRDQGFSSFPQHHRTREASSSWFELVLLRAVPPGSTHPALPPVLGMENLPQRGDPPTVAPGTAYAPHRTLRLHSNLHSTADFVPFTSMLALERNGCTATPGGCTADEARELLREARAGDRFAVRACAQYPQWVNRVRACAIKVEIAAL
ncbi:hypothetical protein JCM10449v2_004258 [Rhodotorula kratochvilovae]